MGPGVLAFLLGLGLALGQSTTQNGGATTATVMATTQAASSPSSSTAGSTSTAGTTNLASTSTSASVGSTTMTMAATTMTPTTMTASTSMSVATTTTPAAATTTVSASTVINTTTTTTAFNTTTSTTTATTTTTMTTTTTPITNRQAQMKFFLDYDRLFDVDLGGSVALFQTSIMTMLGTTYWFNPPITSSMVTIDVAPGAVGQFSDRVTIVTLTFTTADAVAQVARFNAQLANPLTLAITYQGYTFFPVTLNYQLTVTVTPGGDQQFVAIMIVVCFALAILAALFTAYRRKNPFSFKRESHALEPILPRATEAHADKYEETHKKDDDVQGISNPTYDEEAEPELLAHYSSARDADRDYHDELDDDDYLDASSELVGEVEDDDYHFGDDDYLVK